MQMAGEPYPCTESKANRHGHLNKVHNNNYTAAASVAEFHGALTSSAGFRAGSKESDRRSNHSGGRAGKTADGRGEDHLDTVQETGSRFQDAPSFYYTQSGNSDAHRPRGMRQQSKPHRKGAGGARAAGHPAYLLEGPALARHRDPVSKLNKAMNLVYNNQANIHNNMLMRQKEQRDHQYRATTPASAERTDDKSELFK